jgi:hypothetical protein
VPDGKQLVTLTQNPSAPGGAGNTPPAAAAAAPPAAAAANANMDAGGFRRQNGLDAQQLNASFENLSATSPCTGTLFFTSYKAAPG